jgi:hypothetical protein
VKSEQRPLAETPSRETAVGLAVDQTSVAQAKSSPEPTARREAIVRALSRIWPSDALEYGDLVLFDRRSKRNHHVRTFVEAATALALGVFAYVSCALFLNGATGRSACDAVAIPGVWLDLDTKGGAHKKQNLPTRDEALSFVANLPLQPTFILFSGGGLYVWWCFAELWVFETDAERTRAARVVAGWQEFVRDLAAGHGWHVDSTGSLAQVLRPEGSFNDKYSPAREVECIVEGGPRWNPSDFEEWIGGFDASAAQAKPAPQCDPGNAPVEPLRDALAHIDSCGVSYEQWRNVGFGLHHFTAGDSAGFKLWDEWSSRDPARYEGTATLSKLWEGFGRADASRRPVTIRSLVALARAGGWRGDLLDPSFVAPLEAAAPTRPIVRSIDEAVEQVRGIALDFTPGSQSMHVQSWPGCGKTTTFGSVALERISASAPGWEHGAVLALPERALVHEKAERLRRIADGLATPVAVRTLLGRSGEPDSGWYCARFETASLNAEIGRRACSRCPLKGSFEFDPNRERRQWVDGPCASEAGRYLHSRNAAFEPGGLLVTTHAALVHAFGELDERCVIMVDDAGPLLGVARAVELRSSDVSSALASVVEWRAQTESPALVSGPELPEVLVADVVIAVLSAMVRRGRDRTGWIEAAVHEQPEVVKAAIRAGSITKPRDEWYRVQPWPWELDLLDDGPDGSPAFTDLVLDLSSEVLVHGHAPIVARVDRRTVEAGGPDLRIHLPTRRLIERARAGRVAWLSVAPIPEQVATALNIGLEVLHANPTQLELLVGDLQVPRGDRGRTRRVVFGPGERTHGTASPEDTVTRAVAHALSSTHPSFGAVLLKADREALGNPDWCRSYGAGHAGSDELADRELLLVRRFMPPYSALALDACVLRRALGIDGALTPPTSRQVRTLVEARRWRPDLPVIPTAVPADPLERELLRAAEAHGILNAIGRSRALSALEPRLVLVLDGRPFDASGATVRVEALADVLRRLDVLDSVQLPSRDARDAALAHAQKARILNRLARLERLQALVEQSPRASVSTLARRLKCSERTVRGDLCAVRVAPHGQLQHEFASLRRALGGAASSATRSKEEYLCIVLPDLAAADVADAIERERHVRLAVRTVRGHLRTLRRALCDGATLVVPQRSDAYRGLLLVTQAVAHLVGKQVCAPKPPAQVQLSLGTNGGVA